MIIHNGGDQSLNCLLKGRLKISVSEEICV
jgi:hypothetical protein